MAIAAVNLTQNLNLLPQLNPSVVQNYRNTGGLPSYNPGYFHAVNNELTSEHAGEHYKKLGVNASDMVWANTVTPKSHREKAAKDYLISEGSKVVPKTKIAWESCSFQEDNPETQIKIIKAFGALTEEQITKAKLSPAHLLQDLYGHFFYHTTQCTRGYLHQLSNQAAQKVEIANATLTDKSKTYKEKEQICTDAAQQLVSSSVSQSNLFFDMLMQPGHIVSPADVVKGEALLINIVALAQISNSQCQLLEANAIPMGGLEQVLYTAFDLAAKTKKTIKELSGYGIQRQEREGINYAVNNIADAGLSTFLFYVLVSLAQGIYAIGSSLSSSARKAYTDEQNNIKQYREKSLEILRNIYTVLSLIPSWKENNELKLKIQKYLGGTIPGSSVTLKQKALHDVQTYIKHVEEQKHGNPQLYSETNSNLRQTNLKEFQSGLKKAQQDEKEIHEKCKDDSYVGHIFNTIKLHAIKFTDTQTDFKKFISYMHTFSSEHPTLLDPYTDLIKYLYQTALFHKVNQDIGEIVTAQHVANKTIFDNYRELIQLQDKIKFREHGFFASGVVRVLNQIKNAAGGSNMKEDWFRNDVFFDPIEPIEGLTTPASLENWNINNYEATSRIIENQKKNHKLIEKNFKYTWDKYLSHPPLRSDEQTNKEIMSRIKTDVQKKTPLAYLKITNEHDRKLYEEREAERSTFFDGVILAESTLRHLQYNLLFTTEKYVHELLILLQEKVLGESTLHTHVHSAVFGESAASSSSSSSATPPTTEKRVLSIPESMETLNRAHSKKSDKVVKRHMPFWKYMAIGAAVPLSMMGQTNRVYAPTNEQINTIRNAHETQRLKELEKHLGNFRERQP